MASKMAEADLGPLSGRQPGLTVSALRSDRAVRALALTGDIVLCSYSRHFSLTVPLSTRGNPAMY